MKKLQSLQGRTAASGKKCAQKPPDQKRRGEMGEAAFLLKASALGFGVAKPWGDSERYDFIVDVAGSLLRVQVKSAHCRSNCRGRGYTISCGRRHERSYAVGEIDLLVAYIVPEDVWYIFPPDAFKIMRSVRLFPPRINTRSKYEQYREAWDAFREVK